MSNFQAYKKRLGHQYSSEFGDFTNALKSMLDHAEWNTSDWNDRFIVEMITFLNETPTANWAADKIELQVIVEKNKEFYARSFYRTLTYHLN